MKNLFSKNAPKEVIKPLEGFQPTDQLDTSNPPTSGLPKMENPPPPPEELISSVIQDKKAEVKIWKCYRASSCSDVTGFLNDSGSDPAFMIPGTNGQINIFYKG